MKIMVRVMNDWVTGGARKVVKIGDQKWKWVRIEIMDNGDRGLKTVKETKTE